MDFKKPKIGGMMVVGEGEGNKFLKMVLDRTVPLVDIMFIWGDCPDKLTEEIICSYKNIKYYRSEKPQWGKLQWKIKETLLQKYIIPSDIDWVLALDSDEIYDKRITRETLEELTTRGEIAFYFNFVTLWNDENHCRLDGTWTNFSNIRFFKIIRNFDQSYRPQPLHCGLAPIYAYEWGAESEYIMKHYGYMREEDRIKKIERYKKYDPKQIYQSSDWYNSINSKAVIGEFNEEEFSKKFFYVPRRPSLNNIMNKSPEKAFFVRNSFGKVSAVPESLLTEVLNIRGMELVEEAIEEKILKPIEVSKPIEIKKEIKEIKPKRPIINKPKTKAIKPKKTKI